MTLIKRVLCTTLQALQHAIELLDVSGLFETPRQERRQLEKALILVLSEVDRGLGLRLAGRGLSRQATHDQSTILELGLPIV